MGALRCKQIDVVMLPLGSRYHPVVPEGFLSVDVGGPGAGFYIFNPEKITVQIIDTLAKMGEHGSLLGHLYSKSQTASVVVRASMWGGTTIQDSVVPASEIEGIERQKKVLSGRYPCAIITVIANSALVYEQRIRSRLVK